MTVTESLDIMIMIIIIIIIINKTLFLDLKKIDYLQIQEYEILKYIPYEHSSCVRNIKIYALSTFFLCTEENCRKMTI